MKANRMEKAGATANPGCEPSSYCSTSRREFIGGLAAVGAAAFITPAVSGQAIKPWRIDVHHHFMTKGYQGFISKYGMKIGFGKWDVQSDLADMDAGGTETAILSVTNPGFGEGHIDATRAAVRQANEDAAKLRAAHPGRFGNFAALPLTDTEGSLKEIEYALDTLKADGIGIFSSYGDMYLGHASFAPVYEELNRRKAAVFVHPQVPACCKGLASETSIPNEIATIEFGTDTTRAIGDLVFSGMTTKYPNVKWIFAHAGGTMPFLIERFLTGGSAEIVPGVVTKGMTYAAPKNVPGGAAGVLRELRKLHYDTAQSSNPVSMGALKTLVPVSQILFGTDVWYRTTVESVRNLTGCKVFSADELQAIGRGNAERLIPRVRS